MTWTCYSRRYGLPPARLTIISYGHVTAADRGATGQHWAREGTGDLEMAHALAPGAALAYVEVPDDPLVMYDQALSWTVAHVRRDVVSYSSGTPESGGLLRDRSGLRGCRPRRVRRGGRCRGHRRHRPGQRYQRCTGSTSRCGRPLDLLATAVGGTWLHTDAAGRRIHPGHRMERCGRRRRRRRRDLPRSSAARPGRITSARPRAATARSPM